MRSNAIIRILIWSLVILVLVAVLLVGLLLGINFSSPVMKKIDTVQTVVPVTAPVERPFEIQVEPVIVYPSAPMEDVQTTVQVLTATPIYSSPTEEGEVKAHLEAGQQIVFTRQEMIMEQSWIYTTYGVGGWVLAEHLDMEKATNAIILAPTSLRENPQIEDTALDHLTEGSLVFVEKTEEVAGTNWAFLTFPETGWVLAEDLLTDLPTNAIVLTQAIVRSAPSQDGVLIAQLAANSAVRVEEIRGDTWAYITRPESGWVPLSDLNITDSNLIGTAESSPTVPTLPLETAPSETLTGKVNALNASKISGISIEWVVGNIVLEPWDGDTIRISEEGVTDSKYEMVCKMDEDELEIKFCQEKHLKNFRLENITKDLLIQIPRNWMGQELDIDCAAANLEIYGQNFREVEIDGASGTCRFENCDIKDLDLDTASGDVTYSGALNTLDFDAASASFKGVLSNVPSSIDMDSMSGNLELTLPQDAGFTLNLKGMSSDFYTTFPTTTQNGRHICGDGRCRIDVDAMSGDVTIRKAP